MARRKMEKFRQIGERTNVIQPGKNGDESWKGNWRSEYFKNDNPIVLELGCGRGEYTVGLAGVFPEKNFIGVDVKGDRIWKGSGDAIEQGLSNVAFLRLHIQWLANMFAPGEVDEIWITFPDPRPRDRDEKHRLTGPRFLEMYRQLLAPGGTVHLKTDSLSLFEYTLEVLRTQPVNELYYTHDLYRSEFNDLHHGIKTRYEALFTAKGYDINYLQFKFIE